MKLIFKLSTGSRHIHGKPIMVNFSLANHSTEDLWILKWYTPLEGIKGRIFDVICDGIVIPYEGRLMKRAEPVKEDYICIISGGSASATVDLASVYQIPVCKKCELTFRGKICDVVNDEDDIPRASEKHVFISIPGNSVSFSVVPDSI